MAWLQLMTRTNKSVQRIMNKNQKDPKKTMLPSSTPRSWNYFWLSDHQLFWQRINFRCLASQHLQTVVLPFTAALSLTEILGRSRAQERSHCQWLMLLANNNRTTWQSWNYIQESRPSNSPSEPLWTANAWPSWRPHNKCVPFLVFVSTSLYWEYRNSVVVNHPLSPWTLKIKFELHSPY